jgi:uncharacterized membrane protein
MASAMQFPMTHQGVRDLNNPVRPASKKVNVGPNERMASSLGGAVLAGAGVGQGGLCGLALAALGAALISRGQTGHCSLYAAAGINTRK